MRPSSSPSEPAGREPPGGAAGPSPGGLFGGVLAAGQVAGEVGDRAWVRAMLDVEAALARAGASVGLVPAEAAEEITRVCRRVDDFDPGWLGTEAADTGTPVVPLIRALREAVSGDTAEYVHYGATSQDIVDSAAMLVARRALDPLGRDLAAAGEAAARLAAAHRSTPVAARTLLQRALPSTFGLVAAGWLTGLDQAGARLARVREHRLAVQLGGAAGTLAALEPHGLAVAERLAAELDLVAPVLPWHTDRTRIADLAGALGTAAGVAGKIARDVTLYAQTEVGEITEHARGGGSSAMPHKHNPVAAVSAVAAAAQAPGLVATLLFAMSQEYQRAAGAWHAEWLPLRGLLSGAGSAAYWIRASLESLRVHPDRMLANLGAVSAGYLGMAEVLTDRALAAHRGGRQIGTTPPARRHQAGTAPSHEVR